MSRLVQVKGKNLCLTPLITSVGFMMSSYSVGNFIVLTPTLSVCAVLTSGIAVAIQGNVVIFLESRLAIAYGVA
jgi:hypothetical protein